MLIDILNEYKEINLQIINSIKNDKEDIELLNQREKIIQKILLMNPEKDEIKKLYIDMGLKELDIELEKTLKEQMDLVKGNIKKLAKGIAASKSYASVNRARSCYFNDV